MITGTLANRITAGFEPTPARIAQIIAHNILSLPHGADQPIAVLEPTIGVGDLVAPLMTNDNVALVGIEQDPERAAAARARFPQAEIFNAQLEQITLPRNSFSLVLANFPYGSDTEFGFRLEYLMLKQVTQALVSGGVLVTIVPARSGWDDMTIAYIGKHFASIGAWRFFDESPDVHERFSTFSQIVIVATKRATPLLRAPEEVRTELGGWKYRSEDRAFHGTPPPELPLAPIAQPYTVPTVDTIPRLKHIVVSESDVLHAMLVSGVQTSSAWREATETARRAQVPRPLVRYSRTAHIVGGFFTGFLDGVPITVDGRTVVFSSFLTKVKARRALDDGEVQDELAKGALSVAVYRDEPKFMLAALDLQTGETTFASDDAAHQLLMPFLPAIANLVVADQPPIYEPSTVKPWMIQLATTIGARKQLPGAPHPGLAPAQLQMSFALAAGLNTLGHAAEQGAPGTGKTLTTINTMALLAMQYRHRRSNVARNVDEQGRVQYSVIDMHKTLTDDEVAAFVGAFHIDTNGERQWRNVAQPRWVKQTRAAWRHHPTLANHEPRALPIIITSPKRVVESAWGRELATAWPQAEVIQVRCRADLDRVFRRAAESTAPAVIGIVPHSLTRAFTLTIEPHVIPDSHIIEMPDLSEAAAAQGEPVTDDDDVLLGYRDRTTGEMILKQERVPLFRCPECHQVITAPVPYAEDEGEEAPVEDIAWFERQKRTCQNTIRVHRRIDVDSGIDTGDDVTRVCGTPLWTTRRTTAQSERTLNFGSWAKAMETRTLQRGLAYNPRYSRLERNDRGEVVNVAIPTDQSSPFDTLKREYPHCYALLVIDESHNAIGENTDVARSFHHAQSGALMHLYLSGTHYAGTMERFFFYWFRYDPSFWRQFGYRWRDASAACAAFGVIETWVREYEGKANKATGAVQRRTKITSKLAPGIDASLFPYLLSSMAFLSIADIGAMMPRRQEFPHLISMHDDALHEAGRKVQQVYREAKAHQQQVAAQLVEDPDNAEVARALAHAVATLEQARAAKQRFERWQRERDLAMHYHTLDEHLSTLAKNGVAAAALGKGSLLRWYPALCMDKQPFTIVRTRRSVWGRALGSEQIASAPVLADDYIYPLERKLRQLVHQELNVGRRVMIYVEQSTKRDLLARLTHVLRPIARHHRTGTWSLTYEVAATEREAAICQAVDAGNHITLVPYRLVSEGVNLQKHIDTIVWYEMARNRFAQDQASERAYRLGRPIDQQTGEQRDVRLHFLAYYGTAAHRKLRKLAGENVAAQLFAGDAPAGELAHWSGALETTIAQMSANLDEQQRSLAGAFAERDAQRAQLLEHIADAQQTDPVAVALARAWQIPVQSEMLWGRRPSRLLQNQRSSSSLVFGTQPHATRARPSPATTASVTSKPFQQASLFDLPDHGGDD